MSNSTVHNPARDGKLKPSPFRFPRKSAAMVVVALLALTSTMPAGADEWTNVYGDSGPSNFSSADAVAVGPDGSLYILGTFFGDFTGKTSVDEFDVFVMKLEATGGIVWINTWDPDSMDGIDYSEEIGWKRSAHWGEIFVDGAGNIGFTIAEFIAFVDSDGALIASSDREVFGNVSQFILAKPQPDGDGGVVLADDNALNVVAVSSALTAEWVSSHDGYNGTIVPLADGGAIRVYDDPPEFSFQRIAQAVTAYDSNGAEVWNTLHSGRCSGVGSDVLGTLDVVVLPGATSVLVGSKEIDSSQCTRGIELMSAYSLVDGELQESIALPHYAEACSGAPDGSVVDFSVDGATCLQNAVDPENTWSWSIGELIPSVANAAQTEFHGVVRLGISNGNPPDIDALGIAKYSKDNGGLHLVSVTRIGVDDGVSIQDIAVAPSGEAVVVGRAADGSAVLPEKLSLSGVAAAEPATNTQAFVLFDPEIVAPVPVPVDTFTDDDDSIFENDVEWLATEGITLGCNPPANTLYCPNKPVTRGQMAAFLVRGLGLTDSGGGDLFIDDNESVFETSIDKLATAGITKGCNPSEGNTKFCPNDPVTRGQMAAFLVRALGYDDDGGGNLFGDDDDSIFETEIDKLATAGVTLGCNPPVNDMFCPTSNVTRGQMAAFLHRALGT